MTGGLDHPIGDPRQGRASISARFRLELEGTISYGKKCKLRKVLCFIKSYIGIVTIFRRATVLGSMPVLGSGLFDTSRVKILAVLIPKLTKVS
jgi:hypothetical protein